MPTRMRTTTRSQRAFAALLVLCCFLLSTIASFQHADCFFYGAAAQSDAASSRARHRLKPHDSQDGNSRSQIAGATRCVACEWQAANVSVALPAMTLPVPQPQSTSYLSPAKPVIHQVSLRASSRAPPIT